MLTLRKNLACSTRPTLRSVGVQTVVEKAGAIGERKGGLPNDAAVKLVRFRKDESKNVAEGVKIEARPGSPGEHDDNL